MHQGTKESGTPKFFLVYTRIILYHLEKQLELGAFYYIPKIILGYGCAEARRSWRSCFNTLRFIFIHKAACGFTRFHGVLPSYKDLQIVLAKYLITIVCIKKLALHYAWNCVNKGLSE